MATETQVQAFVHKLEEGGWAGVIRFALLVAAIAAVAALFLISDFRGLSNGKAMDQAQVSRELARGNGFSTLMLRPAALAQFAKNKGAMPAGNVPDTYNAPVNPVLNAPFVWLMRESWPMTQKDVIYPLDRMLAGVQVVWFVLAVGLNFLIAKRLFDRRLALLGMGLILITAIYWQHALSGLPQNLMLLIFSGSVYALVRAVEAREEGRQTGWWLALAGLLFGILALTHALTIWIFFGALLFVAPVFRPFWKGLLIMLAVFTITYTPWLARNYAACGNPFGSAVYATLVGVRGSEASVMRSSEIGFLREDIQSYRKKAQLGAVDQITGITKSLAGSIVACVFFVALMHVFKRPEISLFRWAVLLMWLSAVLGMAAAGAAGTEDIQANDLHVLFVPMMIFYGLAFLLYLWTRLEVDVRLLRLAFVTGIYLLSALPLIAMLVTSVPTRVQWPPYVPPFIAILNTWIGPREIITSDMPWAVAWYADRKSLWLPMKIRDFISLHDYPQLGGPLSSIYLTPVSGNQRFLADVVKGEYREWAPFIMRTVNIRDFPLRAVTGLPIDNECVLFADRDRWTDQAD